MLADALGKEAGFDRQLRDTVYWVSLLRYIGCTGHAFEVASLFGDEIAIRARTLVHDAANPAEVIADVIAFATAGRRAEERQQIVQAIEQNAHDWAVQNFASGCEVGDTLACRLGVGADVRAALRFTFERWNGNGYPFGASGEDIPLAMRAVHLTHDMEAIARHFSPARAVEAARERSGRTYDPELADVFSMYGLGWLEGLDKLDPWQAVLDLEPAPRRLLTGADLDEALAVVADFIDLKSPYRAGHSRRCAELGATAARSMGFSENDITTLRRAALVHELGITAVPNSIWDKPGTLTRAELDRVELHPLLTEQMLRRSPALAALAPIAAAHHEKADGSGYHKGLRADAVDPGARVLAAVDVYVGLTADRADRAAFSATSAARELRRLAAGGILDRDTTSAVLAAAGHQESAIARRRRANPAGLTARELDVLQLAARGLATREIAERLTISAKTADHHIQHVYTKIGVSTRAAACLWAIQHDVIR